MDMKKCLSSVIGYITLFTIVILAIPAGILWGATTALWNYADIVMRQLEK